MSNLHDFLVEHATFPFPQPTNERLSVGITDISLVEVPLLEREWKANHAVRDNTLVEKLCNTLKNILGNTLLPEDAEIQNKLLSRFSPRIQLRPNGEEESDWKENPSEIHSRRLLDKGVLHALDHCLSVYGQYDLVQKLEQVADRGSSRVDYVLKVNGEDGCLLEAKSPLVMNSVGGSLPQNGIELTWARRQPLAPKMLTKEKGRSREGRV